MKVEFSPVKEELLPESLPNMEGELDPPINMKVDEDLDIPHVIVKLEEETATETEVDMSAFAPVESSEAEEDEQDELKPPDLSCNLSYKRSPAQRSSARLNRHRIPQSALRDSLEDAGPTRRGLNRTKKARKRKRPKNALCTTTLKQAKSHADEELQTELFPPSKSLKSAVWKHFGYRKNAKGIVEEDGFPVCKLCLRTVTAKGGNTTNMLAHLKVHHRSVYEEIKPVKILEQPPVKLENEDFESELFPPSKSLKSAVWKHFGYRKNVKGFVEEDGFPVCKLCRGKIAARRGNTTNMLAHLKARHYSLYAEIKKVKVEVVTKPIKKNSKQLRAAVWRYFGYPVNMGCVTKDGHPTCQICNQTVDTRRGCTAVMLQHLCLHHSTEYTEIKNEFIRMWPSLEKEIKPSELYPPNKGLKSAVWEHFGYLKNDEGLLEEDGQPLCKLCLRKVMSVGTTSNMRKHLQDHHPFAYAELQTEISDVNPSEIHSPGPGLKSAVWEYFGYLKNADGELEQDGYPICKFCFQKVASKGGTTSNMHKHLKKYHPSVHEAIEKAVNPSSPVIETEEEDHPLKLQSTAVPTLEEEGDNQVESHTEEDFKTELFPPSKSLNSAVWKHFGYRKNAKGIVEEDGFPVCKLCLRTVAAKGGNTSNMLAHLHVHHHCVYEEIKKVKVAVVTKPPKKNSKQLKAAVWRYFGQPINMGCVTEDGHLTCQICNQTVDTRRGDTSVMLQHLCLHHSTEYKEIKDEFIGTLPGLEKEIKPSELYPPNKGLKSAVWEHFGYLKNAEGLLEEDGKPICKLCLRKVVSVGTTSNMRKHLQDHHPFSYAETEREISNVNPSEIHSPGIGFKSAVWEHFGYLKNADGELEQDGYPICKFCFQKVASKGGTTSNMHKHLKKYHPSVHAAIEKAVNPSSPVIETEEEDHPLELQSTAVPTLEEEGDNTPDLYPPKKRAKSAVWEHFGYLKDADGIVKEDDYPICKICFKKVASKGSNTSNMLNHLLVHHQPVFDEMKKTKNPLDPVRMTMTAAVSTLEEERDKPLDLYPPKKRARSAAWEHFGYLKNAEGIVREDDFPICKICFKKVASKGGSTSNMLKHLWVHHQSIFDEMKTGVAT